MATLKLVIRSESEAYARDLRVIGRDLARFAPEHLEIELLDNRYVARFHARHSLVQPKPRKITVLKRVLKRLVPRKTRPAHLNLRPGLLLVNRAYTSDDIDRLYGAQIADRKRLSRSPDLHSLGERMRIVGRIVHARRGTLMRITHKRTSVIIEFYDAHGKQRAEEISHFALYRLQQRYLAQRTTDHKRDVRDDDSRR
ncbi:MAG TPA: hypothetical protein VIB79_20745 [Candidatus Binatia bacterium]|jgi:hypothetical protein